MKNKILKEDKIKNAVKERYQEVIKTRSCCSSNSIKRSAYLDEDYTTLDGYFPTADYQLGCGIPTAYANIKTGNYVLDLGCGAGNDVFIARNIVGKSGKVIGLDMTEEMLKKAEENKTKLGYENVGFVLGEIEFMPFNDETFDVVVSNCVLNLVPNKNKAYQETYRVLKKGGHFCISDVVLNRKLPESICANLNLYAGCVAGALLKEEYLLTIKNAGFKSIEIVKEKTIKLSDEKLNTALSPEHLADFHSKISPLTSITIIGKK